jgi:hypothetical protein
MFAVRCALSATHFGRHGVCPRLMDCVLQPVAAMRLFSAERSTRAVHRALESPGHRQPGQLTDPHHDHSIQVEKAPIVIKEGLSKADAEAMQKQLEAGEWARGGALSTGTDPRSGAETTGRLGPSRTLGCFIHMRCLHSQQQRVDCVCCGRAQRPKRCLLLVCMHARTSSACCEGGSSEEG